jgi:small conductance mechanosensitive channel
MNIQTWSTVAVEWGTRIGLQILVALAIFLVGRWLIGLVVRAVTAALRRQDVDATVLRYLGNDTNRAIVSTFGAAGYPVPEQHVRFAGPAAGRA